MGGRALAALAASLALVAAGCGGPSAPTSFVAESTMAFPVVHLTWQRACDQRCDLEAYSAGRLLAKAYPPAGALEWRYELPSWVAEMTTVLFKLRNVDGDGRESDWVEAPYQTGLASPGFLLTCMQMGSLAREIGLAWYPSPLAEDSRLERFIFSSFDDPAQPPSWEDVPLPPGATSYSEARADEWADHAVFQYRIRSVAGTVEGHPIIASTRPGPPAAPESVTAAVDGSTVRLSWGNRSRVATSIGITSSHDGWLWSSVASLPPFTTYHVETGLAPGLHWYGVEAESTEEIFDSSGVVVVGALVPDPALEPAFSQRTVSLPYADSAARAPGNEWALGSGLVWMGAADPAGVRAPEDGGWALFQSAPGRVLAHPGPLVDPSGRVHAFLGPSLSEPDLATGPIVHVWREDGAWHEEPIGYAVSLLDRQFWAASSPDGSLHVLWRSEPGIPVASYATSRGGAWVVEQVPAPALADEDVGRPLAVAPSGEAAVILPAPAGRAPAFTLYRRTAAGWTSDPVPDDPAVAAPTTLALLAPSGERAAWLQRCGPVDYDRSDVCLRERTAAGWGASVLLAPSALARPGILAAASRDGSRIAVALGGLPDPVQLLVLGGGVTRSWSLPAAEWGSVVGFDAAGKVWVLSGISGWPPGLAWGNSTYALYEER